MKHSRILFAAACISTLIACKSGSKTDGTADGALMYDAALGKTVTALCPPNSRYRADGLKSLVDGRMGTEDYQDLEWLGWWYEDQACEITIDLGELMKVQELGLHTLTAAEAWIFFPRAIEFDLSTDGKIFKNVARIEPSKTDLDNEYPETKIFKASGLQTIARFVRMRAERFGELPDWHSAYGGADDYEGEAWLFIDEILVNPK